MLVVVDRNIKNDIVMILDTDNNSTRKVTFDEAKSSGLDIRGLALEPSVLYAKAVYQVSRGIKSYGYKVWGSSDAEHSPLVALVTKRDTDSVKLNTKFLYRVLYNYYAGKSNFTIEMPFIGLRKRTEYMRYIDEGYNISFVEYKNKILFYDDYIVVEVASKHIEDAKLDVRQASKMSILGNTGVVTTASRDMLVVNDACVTITGKENFSYIFSNNYCGYNANIKRGASNIKIKGRSVSFKALTCKSPEALMILLRKPCSFERLEISSSCLPVFVKYIKNYYPVYNGNMCFNILDDVDILQVEKYVESLRNYWGSCCYGTSAYSVARLQIKVINSWLESHNFSTITLKTNIMEFDYSKFIQDIGYDDSALTNYYNRYFPPMIYFENFKEQFKDMLYHQVVYKMMDLCGDTINIVHNDCVLDADYYKLACKEYADYFSHILDVITKFLGSHTEFSMCSSGYEFRVDKLPSGYKKRKHIDENGNVHYMLDLYDFEIMEACLDE